MDNADNNQFCNAKCCHICQNKFNRTDITFRDHAHFTEQLRGAAHQKCHIKYFNNSYLQVFPIIFIDMIVL